jgi:hypothetical protein
LCFFLGYEIFATRPVGIRQVVLKVFFCKSEFNWIGTQVKMLIQPDIDQPGKIYAGTVNALNNGDAVERNLL